MTTASVLGGWQEGGGPIYLRLASALRDAFRRGEIPTGSRISTERALAREVHVSRATVVAAYDLLREEGWLESRQGSGTWVRKHPSMVTLGEQRPGYFGRSTTTLRGLIEGRGESVEFTVAALSSGSLPLREAVEAALPDLDEAARGHGYESVGYLPLRERIADHMTAWGLPSRAEQIVVTTGAQQAIGMLAALYGRSGDAVVVEDPTYFGAIDIFTALGLRPEPAQVGIQGVRAEAIGRAAVRSGARFAYVMPTYHNPVGVVMPERERREVVAVTTELHLPLVEDLTLADLSLDGQEPPPPIATFAGEVPVLTIGSLSKLMWGGLRLGWIRAPEEVVLRLAKVKLVMDHGSSLVTQCVAARLFERVDEIRAERRRLARERLDLLMAELREHVPGWTWNEPAGGLALWVRLPYGSAQAFAYVAARHGVDVVPGGASAISSGFDDHLRIPFVAEPEVLREGVRRLAAAWDEYAPDEDVPTAVRSVV